MTIMYRRPVPVKAHRRTSLPREHRFASGLLPLPPEPDIGDEAPKAVRETGTRVRWSDRRWDEAWQERQMEDRYSVGVLAGAWGAGED